MVVSAHLRSCSQSRCCPCMKNGRCIRCQCVKKGLSCIDCWPSLSNPKRCDNFGESMSDHAPTMTRTRDDQSIVGPTPSGESSNSLTNVSTRTDAISTNNSVSGPRTYLTDDTAYECDATVTSLEI